MKAIERKRLAIIDASRDVFATHGSDLEVWDWWKATGYNLGDAVQCFGSYDGVWDAVIAAELKSHVHAVRWCPVRARLFMYGYLSGDIEPWTMMDAALYLSMLDVSNERDDAVIAARTILGSE